ncbi:DUF397 domain-containing protein [Nocardiopsis endophytica]
MAETPQEVLVRDTENRALGHLWFDHGGWTTFLADLKKGTF